MHVDYYEVVGADRYASALQVLPHLPAPASGSNGSRRLDVPGVWSGIQLWGPQLRLLWADYRHGRHHHCQGSDQYP